MITTLLPSPAFWPTALLFGGAILEVLLAGFLSSRGKGWLAFIATAAALAASFALLPAVQGGAHLEATAFLWDGGAPLTYYVDGLSVLFMIMGTALGALILMFSIGYMADEPSGTTRFFFLMLIFIGGLTLLVGAQSLLMTYFAWELIGLCSYFLVGFWYARQEATDGARKVLLITHIAGFGFMAAILMIYAQAGTFIWSDPKVAASLSTTIVILLLIASMAKSVLFPLHTWIPEAMNAPTPVSALLHSACYVKAGVYLIARMYAIGDWHPAGGAFLLVVACLTMIVGVVFALAQTDLKRLLAFHTVSQLGYIAAGLAIGTDLGVAAALYYTISHALFKGTLFLCAGSIQHATGTRDLRELGGLYSKMPVTTWVWLIAAAAISGVPLTTGFVAKWLLLSAALDDGQAVVVMVAWFVSILTAFSFMKATVSAFYGDPSPSLAGKHIHEATPTMQVGMGITAVLCVVFGIAPQFLMDPVIAPAVEGLGFNWQIATSWGGVLTRAGSIDVSLGAIGVIVFSVVAAFGAYQLTRSRPGTAVNVFTGGESLPEGDRLSATDFAEMAEVAFEPVYKTDPDPLWLRFGSWLGAVAGKVGQTALWAEDKFIAVTLAGAAVLCVWILAL